VPVPLDDIESAVRAGNRTDDALRHFLKVRGYRDQDIDHRSTRESFRQVLSEGARRSPFQRNLLGFAALGVGILSGYASYRGWEVIGRKWGAFSEWGSVVGLLSAVFVFVCVFIGVVQIWGRTSPLAPSMGDSPSAESLSGRSARDPWPLPGDQSRTELLRSLLFRSRRNRR